jgi:hypothetical protein
MFAYKLRLSGSDCGHWKWQSMSRWMTLDVVFAEETSNKIHSCFLPLKFGYFFVCFWSGKSNKGKWKIDMEKVLLGCYIDKNKY